MATSLVGGAILATVATAALAQAPYTYFDTAADLGMATVTSGYVVLGGNVVLGDGGGGTFMPGAGEYR
jgi:hypothetical protein